MKGKKVSNFLIVTHVRHVFKDGNYWAYGPYVKEMNLWLKHVEGVTVIAPLTRDVSPDPIDLYYLHPQINFISVRSFDLLGFNSIIRSLFYIPTILGKLLYHMYHSDHIHLRCPGNMGLLGALTQVFFPKKKKTVKYAANWDPESAQPFTYKLQQKLVSNTAFSKNIAVLTYGDWEPGNPNLKPFFTASYSEKEIVESNPRVLQKKAPIRLIFVGGLQKAKNPLISLQTCEALLDLGYNVELEFFGQGPEFEYLQNYSQENGLNHAVRFHGNVPAEQVKKAFQHAHFLIFVSESEGWPKVVAESMFWACLPLTSSVSCVPYMLGDELRGDLVGKNVNEIVSKIEYYLNHPEVYQEKAFQAMAWSRAFTLEKFESEIKAILSN
ncbi:MAG: glycosyltransferase family 1 protein [Mongoliibacter sp.]|uniref:glycosyltransferase family 4 protein n=1 Tax=Mongoliibacter sp. TaxID=2022438 RepID=UPI0012F084B8|nr:glycosyltransferase [Mongoliibacter sp.]TVP46535.1 MAG: glycosyltransferase family 1 protein [Mongoliibacter sp.]